ncbi:MAG: DegQ family serine endoprotease [Deltaproteobacteria bacterium]|nr:DegQ family serine endoprotease [Deltaproteobacteria bacterium]
MMKQPKSLFFIMFLVLCLSTTTLLTLPENSAAQTGLVPDTFAILAKQISAAVVNISTEKVTKRPTRTRRLPGTPGPGPSPFGPDDPFKDFFERFFGDMPKEFRSRSLGSGFIFDREGYIITNNHVIEGADKIRVKLLDGREFKAVIKGRDPMTDLALIKIESPTHDLPVLPLGNSDAIQVGDWVLAVGNPFGLSHTVTQGIISAKGRVIGAGPYDDFLQTDASINPGNSGGPLVNLKGEVVGINSAIVATGQGIGFAIPSNMAQSIIPQLKEKGTVVRGLLGVQIQTVTPELAKSFGLKEPMGALVAEVNPGTPAAKVGLQRGDIITEFNGTAIKEMHELPKLVAHTAPGQTVKLKVVRGGKEQTFSVTIAEMKPEHLSRSPEPEGEAEKSSLGMMVQELTPSLAQNFQIRDTAGVIVVQVEQGSPAFDSGIRPGDLVNEINGVAIQSLKDYHGAISQLKAGSTARVLVKRRGKTMYVVVEVPEQ